MICALRLGSSGLVRRIAVARLPGRQIGSIDDRAANSSRENRTTNGSAISAIAATLGRWWHHRPAMPGACLLGDGGWLQSDRDSLALVHSRKKEPAGCGVAVKLASIEAHSPTGGCGTTRR